MITFKGRKMNIVWFMSNDPPGITDDQSKIRFASSKTGHLSLRVVIHIVHFEPAVGGEKGHPPG